MAGSARHNPEPTIAWHGLSLHTPPSWAPSKMTGDAAGGTLAVTDGALTRLHLDWSRPLRRPNLDRRLRRILKHLAKEAVRRNAFISPAETTFPLPADKTARFAKWPTALGCAVAGVIYCAACRRLTTVRAAFTDGEDADVTFAALTRSFHDHPAKGELAWSLCHFSAKTPASAVLLAGAIEPGRIDLTFRDGADAVRISQLGLARTVLAGTTLREWLAAFWDRDLPGQSLELAEETFREHPSLTWHAESSGLARRARSAGRAWWCVESNRIYVVSIRSKKSPEDRLTRWCKGVNCHPADASASGKAGAVTGGPFARRPRLTPRVKRLDRNGSGCTKIVLRPNGAVSRERIIELDPLGSLVLDRCDGRATVGAIIESFSREHRLHPREAQVCVASFLKMLAERGVIEMPREEG